MTSFIQKLRNLISLSSMVYIIFTSVQFEDESHGNKKHYTITKLGFGLTDQMKNCGVMKNGDELLEVCVFYIPVNEEGYVEHVVLGWDDDLIKYSEVPQFETR